MSTSSTPAKDTRLHVRCRSEDKKRIEQAARSLGLSVSDYLLSSALERAAQAEKATGLTVPCDHQSVRSPLSPADTRTLLSMIFTEGEPEALTPKMQQAIERYNRVFGGGDNA